MTKEYGAYSQIHTNVLNAKTTLENTVVLACQHMLMPNCRMLQSMYAKGLKPKNLHVVTKTYSYNQDVVDDLTRTGANVYYSRYSSHVPFDLQFRGLVGQVIDAAAQEIVVRGSHLLVLDDGGVVLQEVNRLNANQDIRVPIYGVEQTSSGYHALVQDKLTFPIVNVARSKTKLEFESPVIAQHVIACVGEALADVQRQPKSALVIGTGYIGKSILNHFGNSYPVESVDIAEQKLTPGMLRNAELIIGCTGDVSIPQSMHKYLPKNAILCSVSSSDREFDAVYLRQKVDRNTNPHAHLKINGKLLLNSGFPITFRGKKCEGEVKKMIVTHSLMLEGAYQALSSKAKGLEDLDMQRQFGVLYNYCIANDIVTV